MWERTTKQERDAKCMKDLIIKKCNVGYWHILKICIILKYDSLGVYSCWEGDWNWKPARSIDPDTKSGPKVNCI